MALAPTVLQTSDKKLVNRFLIETGLTQKALEEIALESPKWTKWLKECGFEVKLEKEEMPMPIMEPLDKSNPDGGVWIINDVSLPEFEGYPTFEEKWESLMMNDWREIQSTGK